LARVDLYLKNWSDAEAQASSIISNTTNFNLNPDLNQVFFANNPEAILQWKLNTTHSPYNATSEGNFIIPNSNTIYPEVYIRNELLNAFEVGDLRKAAWTDSTTYAGTVYYYPYKYKIGPAQRIPNGPATEYYMVLRLAEQYLIRAEARAYQNNIDGGAADVNLLRTRASLPNISVSTQSDLLAAIAHERRIELFAEWGNRWFDLKRNGFADSVLAPIKPLWQSYQQLYPIPAAERQLNPNLSQNPGYTQ
jgi:hypothetical protein